MGIAQEQEPIPDYHGESYETEQENLKWTKLQLCPSLCLGTILQPVVNHAIQWQKKWIRKLRQEVYMRFYSPIHSTSGGKHLVYILD